MAEPDADSPDPAPVGAALASSSPEDAGGTAQGGDDPHSGGLECARCGALLPEGDEGICTMCGMPFGFKTREMPILDAAYLAKHGHEPAKTGTSGAPKQPFMPASRQVAVRQRSSAPRPAKLIALGVLLATLVLLGVLLTVLMT